MAKKKIEAYQKKDRSGKIGGYFYYKFMIDGVKTLPVNTFLVDKREADRVAQEAYDLAKAEAIKAKREGALKANRPKDMTVDQLCISYWTRHVEPKELRDKVQIGKQLHIIRDTIGKDTMVSAIDDDVVETYVAALRAIVSERTKRPLKPHTRNHQLMRLQNIMGHARTVEKIQTQIIDWERFRIPKNKLNARSVRYITPEETALIHKAMRPDYYAIFEMEYATGLRRKELVGLTWDKVDEINGAIVLKQKGNRDHLIVITSDIAAILAEQKPHKTSRDSAVFTFIGNATMTNNKTGKAYVKGERYPITYWGIGSYWKGLIEGLKKEHAIPHITLHDFRKTFTSDFIMAAGLTHASAAAGHSNEAVTEQAYKAIPTPERIRAAELAKAVRLEKGRFVPRPNAGIVPQIVPQRNNG